MKLNPRYGRKSLFRTTYLVQWSDRYGVTRTERYDTLEEALHMAEMFQDVYHDLFLYEGRSIHVRAITEYAELPL